MSKNSTYDLLKGRYPEHGYVIMQEVSDTVGHARSRSLDYMVASLWPSRGLSLTGIEVKSWRNDWLKELKNPAKQEKHYKYCDYFYLLTTDDKVAKLEEIPKDWGWLHVAGSTIREMKKAPLLKALPLERSFFFAMLRRAATKDGYIRKDSIEDAVAKEVKNKVDSYRSNEERLTSEIKQLQSNVKKIETAFDINLATWTSDLFDKRERIFSTAEDAARAYKFIVSGGMDAVKLKAQSSLNKLKEVVGVLNGFVDSIAQENQKPQEP